MNLFNLRTLLGLTTTEAGQLLHVTRRTWELWESGKQKIPPAKEELLLKKIDLYHDNSSNDVVVIIQKTGLSEIPLDVVGSRNFLACDTIGNDEYIVKSLAIDKQSLRPYVHKTRFLGTYNQTALKHFSNWKSQLSD
ncbi:Aca2/YdiL-like domain-containing protein [Bergeriella denitrificans]|uniref:Uncharacterized protein n=1 Tax=Bergeriella denitrificans TaxID=494 RepID=A0A378UJY6_BERDE|nr:DUF1870 family protein [Bergeriella denitrificans]STZ77440.1 Uncharacterised protein [Bergeriella denitrificans]